MPIENFDHDEFRSQLAKDLKSVPDHKERKAVLESEQDGARYKEAKAEHLHDVEVFQKLMETNEGKAEIYGQRFWEGVLDKETARIFMEHSPRHCSCAITNNGNKNFGQNIVWEVEHSKTKSEKDPEIVRKIKFLKAMEQFSEKIIEESKSEEHPQGRNYFELLKERFVASYNRISELIGEDGSEEDFLYELLSSPQNCVSRDLPTKSFKDRLLKKALVDAKAS